MDTPDGTSGASGADTPHYRNRSPRVLVTSAVFLAIATVFIVMRSVSKFGIRKRADVDDGVIILAWLFTVALSVTVIIGAAHGLGQPDTVLRQHPEWWSPLKKSVYVFPIFYHLSAMTAKSAALLLYIRMARAHTFLRYASYVVLIIVDISGVVLILMNIFQCRPLAAAWTWDDHGQCFDSVTLFLSSSPINILSDLAILYLPLPIITGLRIERTAKIGLVLAFLCGIFVAVVDVVRIAYLQTALKAQLIAGGDHVSASDRPPNYYWSTSWGVMWAAIECSVRIACCCALVLKPFLQKLWPSTFFSQTGSRILRSRNRNSGSGNASGGQQNGNCNNNNNNNNSNNNNPNNHRKAPSQGPEMSVLSHKSLQQMPIHAILQCDPDTNEEDCMDLAEFFAAGPAEPGQLNRASGFGGDGPSSPRLGVGHFGLGLSKSRSPGADNGNGNDESPASSDTMGAPLVSAPTRISMRRWSMLTAPMRWVTNEGPHHIDQTQQPTQNFFDFFDLGRRKPLTELTPREAWWPVMFVNILFFLWGFSYGLLGNLNNQIMTVIPHSTSARQLALQNSYWLGYIIGPSTIGAYTLTKHGFKATFMTGLVIYGCGTMCFWPSSVLASFAGFVFCNLLIAMGLSILEVAANPFIALAGPGELSEARLNFSQGIQAIASIVSPILAEKVFFRTVGVRGRVSLFDVQWCYLAVALFVLFLAFVFFYVPLSEATDDELEAETVGRLERAGLNLGSRAYNRHISARWFIIIAGTVSMMFYVGAQESLSYFWAPFIKITEASASRRPFWDLTIAHGLFAASRFIAAGMCYIGFTPRFILNICCTATFITTLLAVVLPKGNGAYVCVLLALFFEGPVFPTLFATALRGQGRWTKRASIALTASIGLAVVWQSSTWAIYTRTGDIRTAWILVVVMCFIQALYPIVLAASPTLRRFVDPKWSRGPFRPSAGRTSISAASVKSRHDEKPALQRARSLRDYDRNPDRDPADMHEFHDEKASLGRVKSHSGSGRGTTVTVKSRTGSGQTEDSANVTPVLPSLPEEDPSVGPTEHFAGIGVVGELPEIK